MNIGEAERDFRLTVCRLLRILVVLDTVVEEREVELDREEFERNLGTVFLLD